jgi:Tfp pilus assembly protein PilZ
VLISGERRTAHFRAHERRVVQIQASVWHPGGAEAASVNVLNLGLGGAGISCQAVLRAEDRVMLTLQSESLLDPLALAARVAWVLPAPGTGGRNAGLSFETPDRSALLTLFQLIGTLTAQ